MADCELIENTACGKSFTYCRTHKVESKDCPKAKSGRFYSDGQVLFKPGDITHITYAAPRYNFSVWDFAVVSVDLGPGFGVGKVVKIKSVNPNDQYVVSDASGRRGLALGSALQPAVQLSTAGQQSTPGLAAGLPATANKYKAGDLVYLTRDVVNAAGGGIIHAGDAVIISKVISHDLYEIVDQYGVKCLAMEDRLSRTPVYPRYGVTP